MFYSPQRYGCLQNQIGFESNGLGAKHQACAIEAMTFACWRRSVVENVTQMAAASATMRLSADLKQFPVRFCAYRIWQALVKAWPARAAVVFGR